MAVPRERHRLRLGRAADDGRGVRRVRLRRHLLLAHRDRQRHGTGRRARGPAGRLPPGDRAQVRERAELRAEQRLAGHRDPCGAPPFPSAGKTGTTTENEYTWFVGYTPGSPRPSGSVTATASARSRTLDQRQVRAQGVRLVGRGADLEAVHDQALDDGAPNPEFADPGTRRCTARRSPSRPSSGSARRTRATGSPRPGSGRRSRPSRSSPHPRGHRRGAEPVGHGGARLVHHAHAVERPAARRTSTRTSRLPGWPGNGGGGGNGNGGGNGGGGSSLSGGHDVRRRPHRGSTRARRCGRARVRLADRGALVHAA